MLSHGIALSLVAIDALIYLADKRKQYRSVPVPVSRVSLPDSFMLFHLVINTAQFRSVRRDCDLQELVFNDMHFTTHVSLLVAIARNHPAETSDCENPF